MTRDIVRAAEPCRTCGERPSRLPAFDGDDVRLICGECYDGVSDDYDSRGDTLAIAIERWNQAQAESTEGESETPRAKNEPVLGRIDT